MSTPGPGDSSPLDVCKLAVRLVEVTGAGLSVMTSAGHRGTVCATDSVAGVLEELQFTLGEGPCVDAFQQGPVLIDDLSDDEHVRDSPWPQFTRQASQAGARALFAIPLQIGAIRIGAFDLYRDSPGGLTDRQLSVALTLADAAAGSLLSDRFGRPIDRSLDPSEPGASYHAEVHQATGMLSVRLGISLDDAFVRLRARAFASERTVNDVAHDIVQGRLGLTEEDGGQQ